MTDETTSLTREIERAAPRRWWNPATVVLGAALLLVGGFVGGLHARQPEVAAPGRQRTGPFPYPPAAAPSTPATTTTGTATAVPK